MIIDAALELCAQQGYDATTVNQIAAKAGLSPADFAEYFASTEAVVMSIVDDMSHATAVALKDTDNGVAPERALLNAGTSVLTAVVEGHGAVTVERLLAMARIVTTTRNLQRKVSAARKRVITQPLADWMGVDPKDQRLQRALTMWSAVTANVYVNALGMPHGYEPQYDDHLRQRVVADLSQSFGEVMGEDPGHPE